MAERRNRSFNLDQAEIFSRIQTFYKDDMGNRDFDRDARLSRYAKYRMWVEPKDWPWPDASNVPLSDMMEQSLRSQDTIHNAVMTNRPVINATARNKANKDNEQTIEDLIDFQVFVEAEGEKIIGDAADAFLNDGVLTIFCPWVKEVREVNDLVEFGPVPETVDQTQHFVQILTQKFPEYQIEPKNKWDFKLTKDRSASIDIKFYTTDDGIEMTSQEEATVFDGPTPIVMDYEDVLHPVRAANLQIPGPANPGGSSHVILQDNPSVDEIKRLREQGFYDLMTDEDIENLEKVSTDRRNDEEEDQKDSIAGKTDEPNEKQAASHTKLTRLLVFDTYDIDDDGLDEDVMFWVILELKIVVKAAYLGQMYPFNPPRRPFAEASLIPVRGRRVGISMLEMIEGLHDVEKSIMDQAVDSGTMSNVPFFFYRASAGVRPEVIRLQPGDGYPVSDPNRDVNFPQIGNPNAQNFAINMMTLITQMKEKVTLVGDIQLGRVPPGRSSALRTASGLALLSGQGEARPERILRRFFIALSDLWEIIHQLNQQFLPKEKQFRISGGKEKVKDPYKEIIDRREIQGNFDFGFQASVLNTSKQAMQEGLEIFMQQTISELALQLGISNPDTIYRQMRDFGRLLGLDADSYLNEPAPGAGLPQLSAEEVIQLILNETQPPPSRPMEPAQEHLDKLQAFIDDDSQFGRIELSTAAVDLLAKHMQFIQGLIQQEAERAQLLQAAEQFGTPQGGGTSGPQGSGPGDLSNPPINNELLDETLPGAGGGGNVQ